MTISNFAMQFLFANPLRFFWRSCFMFFSSSHKMYCQAQPQLNSTQLNFNSKAKVSFILKQIQPPTHPPDRTSRERRLKCQFQFQLQLQQRLVLIYCRTNSFTHPPTHPGNHPATPPDQNWKETWVDHFMDFKNNNKFKNSQNLKYTLAIFEDD